MQKFVSWLLSFPRPPRSLASSKPWPHKNATILRSTRYHNAIDYPYPQHVQQGNCELEYGMQMKRPHHKVATGCANCKRRHVKCDEREGGCMRCQTANLFCPGYNPPVARIFQSSVGRFQGQVNPNASNLIREPDPRAVWQLALLNSFITTWLPDSMVREYSYKGKFPDAGLMPMAAWPAAAWRIAMKKDDSFVAHALLCLILCVIGSRTGDQRLITEVLHHYARVLNQFQAHIGMFMRTGYSTQQDNRVASLAAAGFCCSQVEYILHSWGNGDRHLEGMASLLNTCGPACTRDVDVRDIFYDHCLLWTSCSITHRRPAVYSQQQWVNMQWMDSSDVCTTLLSTAQRIPHLLAQYDSLQQGLPLAESVDLLRQLVNVVADLESVEKLFKSTTVQPESHDLDGKISWQENPLHADSYKAVVLTGYCSAFALHAAIAAWDIVRSVPIEDFSDWTSRQVDSESLKDTCVRHVAVVQRAIDQISSNHVGIINASPLLFLLDSAWSAYTELANYSNLRLDEVVPSFGRLGRYLSSIAYSPLREPWKRHG